MCCVYVYGRGTCYVQYQLCIANMKPTRATPPHVPPTRSTLHTHSSCPTLGILDPSFAEYLVQFIDHVGQPKQDARLFLHRNLPSMDDTTLNTYPPTLLAKSLVRNGLECKIACASSKVSYVLDTEDLFFRAKAPHTPNEPLKNTRAARFREKVDALCKAVPEQAPAAVAVVEGGAQAGEGERVEEVAAVAAARGEEVEEAVAMETGGGDA